jgi:hypothetical protein
MLSDQIERGLSISQCVNTLKYLIFLSLLVSFSPCSEFLPIPHQILQIPLQTIPFKTITPGLLLVALTWPPKVDPEIQTLFCKPDLLVAILFCGLHTSAKLLEPKEIHTYAVVGEIFLDGDMLVTLDYSHLPNTKPLKSTPPICLLTKVNSAWGLIAAERGNVEVGM